MAIKRRILRKHYKIHNKNFKQFNKIKMNIIRNTHLSKILKNRKLAERVEKQHLNYLPFWQKLSALEQEKEIVFAKNDIKIFGKYAENMPSFENKKFQSYLPKSVWRSMTQQQRKSHLQKRDAVLKKNAKLRKKYLSMKRPKLYFSNIKNRVWLANISKYSKIAYLRILLTRAQILVKKKSVSEQHPVLKMQPAIIELPMSLQHLVNFKNILKRRIKIKNTDILKLLPKKRIKKYV